MSHFQSPSFSRSPTHRKSWPKRIESCLCKTCSFFPLTFVYGLTTWALVTEIRISFLDDADVFALAKALLGLALYALANVSYSVAVWTGPGSPLDERRQIGGGGGKKGGYEGLPRYEDDGLEDGGNATPHGHASGGAAGVTTVTAKSTGKQRFCKKCHTDKPDRTHHCSTCGRCVLKMDHHCPWLATCVGLRNYKPFLLFLMYTCLFCWTCFAVTGSWVWAAISNDSRITSKGESAVVNCILLAVLSGIIGLVLTGFTAWHMWLVTRGETTIESLEKTRYLNPLRKNLERRDHHRDEERQDPNAYDEEGSEARENQSLLDQLKETHANALPGVLRPEEGESTPLSSSSPTPQPPAPASSTDSPAKSSLQQSYASLEQQREQDRYDRYLDEVSNQQLPNAFDLGWRRNLLHVFGHSPVYWCLPVCNTTGDGWQWEVSTKWMEAREEQIRERAAREREEAALRGLDEESTRLGATAGRDWRWVGGQGFVDRVPRFSGNVQMQPLDRRKPTPPKRSSEEDDESDAYDSPSDEDRRAKQQWRQADVRSGAATTNWNDIPDEFITRKANGGQRSRSRGRQKGD